MQFYELDEIDVPVHSCYETRNSNEMALLHFGKEYGGNASENYERYFVSAIGAPLAVDLVDRAMIRPGERVLDVACGTGIVARIALERVGHAGSVTGLDINPGMLAVARSVCPPDIEWHEAGAEEMPLPDNGYDVVLCQASLMFMPDREKALSEMYRVLAPGGRILLNAPGPPSPLWEAFIEALRETIGPEAAGFLRRVFSLHNEDEMRQLMHNARFEEVSVSKYVKHFILPAPKEFLWQYVNSTPLGGLMMNADEGQLNKLENEIAGRWRRFEEDGHLTDNLAIGIAGARKPAANIV